LPESLWAGAILLILAEIAGILEEVPVNWFEQTKEKKI
jgi:hypothetical protein